MHGTKKDCTRYLRHAPVLNMKEVAVNYPVRSMLLTGFADIPCTAEYIVFQNDS